MTTTPPPLTPALLGRLVYVLRAAHAVADARRAEVRRLRNVLILAVLVAGLMAIGLVVLGTVRPSSVPLCEHVAAVAGSPEVAGTATSPAVPAVPASPARDICPGGGLNPRYNMVLVALFGALGATIAIVFKVDTSAPKDLAYSVTVPQLALKLPAGVLTAVAGTVLLRSELLSVVEVKHNRATILILALFFGYAQQALTHFIDQKATAVVNAAKPQTG
ncbi:hypothetical protein R8Z50_26665 [Longispora sp. K20-0274]|uniref:hypothetical protein n=1 Tax=Longispora sp. K20-0274 TaxID=3088255 RepID=UPI003999B1E9